MVLASGIEKEHLKIWDELFAVRFAALEVEKLLIYHIDTVDAKALPFLAEQFNVTGLKGWNAAKTEQDRRNLIKRAIELKRYQGTPFAIIRAMKSVGYLDAEVLEGTVALYNGLFRHDGNITHGGGSWAQFAVIVDIGESKGIGTVETNEAIDLINVYKNARSKLMGIGYKATLTDFVSQTEEFLLAISLEYNEGVDPINDDDLQIVATQEQIDENLDTLDDGGLTLNIVDSQGNTISTETL
jgi:P2-related tail formation protein